MSILDLVLPLQHDHLIFQLSHLILDKLVLLQIQQALDTACIVFRLQTLVSTELLWLYVAALLLGLAILAFAGSFNFHGFHHFTQYFVLLMANIQITTN